MSRRFETINSMDDDGELFTRMVAGDESALGALYDRYAGMLYSLALRMAQDAHAAEEAVQNTFLSAWRSASSFDRQRGKASTWLVAILKNQVRDQMRKRKRRESFMADFELDEALQAAEVDHLDARLQAGEVREALRRLPKEQRAVVALTYFWGLTHREAAALLRVPLGTVKSRLRLAIERLGDMIERGRRPK